MKKALLIVAALIVIPGSLTAWPLIAVLVIVGRRVGWGHG